MTDQLIQETVVRSVAPPQSAGDPLLVANLLSDLDGLMKMLVDEIARESWLNSFLLAAGANQVAEDRLHENSIARAKISRYVRRVVPGVVGRAAAASVRAVDAAAWAARSVVPGDSRLDAWQLDQAGLVDLLADAVAGGEWPDSGALLARAERLRSALAGLPMAASRSVLRLPSCFRNFDQHPDDLEQLTDYFSLTFPDRSRPVAVVGVRTSGSYTAPLHGAYLRARGFDAVSVLTFRPGQRWRRVELEALRSVRAAGGTVLLTDDPPKSGGSLARAARALERLGFDVRSIVLLLPLLSDVEVPPPSLRRYPSVLLPWEDWSVHARLEPSAVRDALAEMVGADSEVRSVHPLAMPAAKRRGHVRSLYRAQLCRGGDQLTRDICVEGVGIGYFGDHALAGARRLTAFLPDVTGVRDGLLYREWLPEGGRVDPSTPGGVDQVAAGMVDYVTSRASALGVDEDTSLRLVDRGAVWQRAGDIITRAFGPASQFMRPVAHPLLRRLLRVDRPSVIDGACQPGNWFQGGEMGRLRKVDFDKRAFCSLDIYSYDHVFDLAGCVSDSADSTLTAALHNAYIDKTGAAVDPERWLMYRLVHVAERQRDDPVQRADVERAFAREMQRYYGETFFSHLTLGADAAGPMCAIDVDWVLETPGLGFPSITPAGVGGLRALVHHGYRVVLASGRSLEEVRERCSAYRLAGGVAEYGAAVYDRRTGCVHELLTAEDRRQLATVRSTLAETPGVVLDDEYRRSVRAYTFDKSGHRHGLEPESAAAILLKAGVAGTVRAIAGGSQTDFMVNTIDKAAGLRLLAVGEQMAMAIGDSAEDLPMMGMARLAAAPANADAAVRAAGVRIFSRPCQAGLAQAVEALLGHRPGECAVCEAPHLELRSRLLLTLLSAQDARGPGKIGAAVRTALALARAAR
jgi:hydroxymethylpyrimidine pyrophosphatase-like HAD family hydrolase